MGCGGSRGEAMESVNASLEGLTGDALAAAMRTNNVKTKWKEHKGPIDMDLLKELGLADDYEGPKPPEDSPKGSATSRKTIQEGENKNGENAENG